MNAVVAIATLAAIQAAQPQPIALLCTGSQVDRVDGDSTEVIANRTFVLDEVAGHILERDPDTGRLGDVCAALDKCDVTFSEDRISALGHRAGSSQNLSVYFDRRDGRVVFIESIGSAFEKDYSGFCSKTKLPSPSQVTRKF